MPVINLVVSSRLRVAGGQPLNSSVRCFVVSKDIMRILRFVGCFALLCAASNGAYAQTEVCSLTTYFRDLESKEQVSSSRFLVGSFPLQLADDELTKFFHHQESGINISVGIQMIRSIFSEKEPKRMRLAISFTGKPDDVYDLLEGAGAESIYDKHWKWLSVSNNIKVGGRIYTFTFGCERKNQKRGR